MPSIQDGRRVCPASPARRVPLFGRAAYQAQARRRHARSEQCDDVGVPALGQDLHALGGDGRTRAHACKR